MMNVGRMPRPEVHGLNLQSDALKVLQRIALVTQ